MAAMHDAEFLASLPVERRLALAYAPLRARRLWLGLFALDARLGTTVHKAAEPMLTQIKLAWWRDELAKPQAERRRGEPLLALLEDWGDDAACLGALVNGWKLVLGAGPIQPDAALEFAGERARACVSLAKRLGLAADDTAQAAQGWALADIGAALAEPVDFAWRPVRLPRELRPLQVLYGLAARNRGQGPLLSGPIAAIRAVGLGLLGI